MSDTEGRLVRSGAIVGAGAVASRVTGLLRTLTVTAVLGTSAFADAYNFANNIPNIVYELVAGGVLSAALLPVVVDLDRRKDTLALRAVLTRTVGAVVVLAAVAVLAAPLLGELVARLGGGGVDAAESREAAVVLLRWFLPQIAFYGVMTAVVAVLHARGRFALAAFAPMANNLVTIAAFVVASTAASSDLTTLSLRATLDERWVVTVIAAGTTLGVAANAGLLVAGLRGGGVLRPTRRSTPALLRLRQAAVGALAVVLVTQVSVVITAALAKRYGALGDYSAYTYANLLFFVVYGVVAVSVTTAMAPEFARTANDPTTFGPVVARGVRLLTLLVAPAALGLAALAVPVAAALPLRSEAATRTADILVWFALGLAPYAVLQLVLRACWAREDRRTPLLLVVVQQAGLVVPALVLGPLLGIVGIAAAFAIGYAIGAVVAVRHLVVGLRVLDRGDLAALGRVLGCSVATAAFVVFLDRIVIAPVGFGAELRVVVGAIVGAAAYLGVLTAAGAGGDLRILRGLLPAPRRERS